MAKVLVATEKPFHPRGVKKMKEIFKNEGYEAIFLEKYSDVSELIDKIKDAEGLIVRSDKVTEEIINNAPNLKVIVRAGAGYDNIDLKKASDKNIVAMNTPGQNSNAVAELALGMMIYFARNKFNGTSGTELRDKTLGIHAYGNVGRIVGDIAQGFGMTVYGFDPYVPDNLMKKEGVIPVQKSLDLYKNSQFVSLNIPANEKTRHSINHKLLTEMPEHAVLVNTARKEVINEDDLLKVFKEREDFYYLSDIKPDCHDELIKNYEDRVFFTPKKMGAQTVEANINAGVAAANQVIGFIERDDRTFQVNE